MENEKRNQQQDSAKSFDEAGAGVDSRQILSLIRDEPLMAAGVAATAGFIVGGGLAGTAGVAVIGLVARTAIRTVVLDLVGMMRNQIWSGASRHAPANV